MRSARRNTELGLLVLSTLVIIGAYWLASMAQGSEIRESLTPFLLVILGAPVVGHIAVRKFAPEADGMLLPLASLLNGLGYVFIVRLDEHARFKGNLPALQASWLMLGMGAFVATLIFLGQTRSLERYRYTAGLVGLMLLLLPLLPVIGVNQRGSRIWVALGPLSFQPGEFAKLALAVFFAGYLVDNRELLAVHRNVGALSVPDPKHLGPVLVAWGASLVVMILERDLGSSLLFFTLFMVLLWWRPSGRPTWSSARCCSPRAWCSRSTRSPTCASASTSGRTPSSTRTAPAASSSRRCTPWPTAGCWAPASTWVTRSPCRWPGPTSSSPPSPRSWGSWGPRRSWCRSC
jgi:hypothetical protein